MKVYPDKLAGHLQKQAAPLYWIAGDETLLVGEACDTVRRFAREHGYGEREVRQVDGSTDFSELLASANSLSLFAERKLLEIRFGSARVPDSALKALGDYLANPNDETLVLVTSPKLDGATTRTKSFKAVEGKSALVQVWPVERGQFNNWLAGRCRRAGISASPEIIAILAERTEGNLLAAQQEIEKLALLAGSDGATAEAALAAVTESARFDPFGLADRAMSGDAPGALRTLNGLAGEGVEPLKVLAALTSQLHRLLALKAEFGERQPSDTQLEQKGIWRRRQGPVRRALKQLDTTLLEQGLLLARSADANAKGRGDPWQPLAELCLLLAGAPVTLSLSLSRQ